MISYLNTTRPRRPIPRSRAALRLAAGIACGLALSAQAQTPPAAGAQQPTSGTTLLAELEPNAAGILPNAPGSLRDSVPAVTPGESSSSLDPTAPAAFAEAQSSPARGLPMAARTDLYIAPGQPVPTLTFRDKFNAGLRNTVTPFAGIGWLIAAGYSQGVDSSPNYGQDGKAFAQRLGAAAARSSSEGVFANAVLAGVFHEDARYYCLGPGHSVVRRVVHAGTRTLITRTDSGRTTPNFALLGGNLAGAYLTGAYYPPNNTTTSEIFSTFGGALGGSAIGFVAREFLSGARNVFHSANQPPTVP